MATTDDTTTDLGTDVQLVQDTAPVWGLSTSDTNLANAIARRLGTPRGGLFYDPDYGYDLRAHLNQAVTDADMSAIRGAVLAEIAKDPRIQGADATIARGSLEVGLSLETAAGTVDLVLAATDVSVEVLSIGGVPPVAVAAPVLPTTITRIGEQGAPGLQGPAGPSGDGAGSMVVLDDSAVMAVDSTDEEVVFQWSGVDFDELPASLTAELVAEVLSLDGTSTFRLRIGGSDGIADGDIVLEITTALAVYSQLSASASIADLTGILFVKITAENATIGQDARIRAPVVTLR